MTDTIFMHDGSTRSFATVDEQGITVDDDGEAEFTWDEVPVVKVDAPSDLEGAFDTERFFKITGATIARPIKQPYHVGDGIETYKKPAEELRKAAWSFDNSPFTLNHPNTGMVKDVNDVHGFFRNVRYNSDDDRLKADLYIPETDVEARDFVSEHQDVSVGFFNRVYRDYDGNTGDLTDEEGVDGYQVDIYGNHVAGVKRGRCSSEHGCGLDGDDHGRAVMVSTPPTADGTTSFLTKEDQTKKPEDEDSDYEREHDSMDQTNDRPSGIKEYEGTWYAVGPDEHTKDSTNHPGDYMYPVDNCSDVKDAWDLRGHAKDLSIDESTLEARIKRAGEAMDCDMPDTATDDSITISEDYDPGFEVADCIRESDPCDSKDMTDDDFDIPDLSIDALAEQNDQVHELKAERDEYREALDALRDELDLDEDEDPREEVPELKEDREEMDALIEDIREALGLDEEANLRERVEDVAEEWQEFRADEHEKRLDRIEELGAEREKWEDESLDALEEEIERREEVFDAIDNASPTGIEESEDEGGEDTKRTISGKRQFGRGHAARPEAE